MKAKYLFYSLALASAFTACTQDELFDAPALESNQVANRPVAGVVTFVGDEIESRYNSETASFEDGDQMGIYLMDEFRGWGELPNANKTYWQWQSCWWNMYDMVDYISTNYGYVYDAETGEWVNRASQLLEGNYIALFPQNTRATNRRDLWHPIKGSVDLVDHSSTPRYYVNRENQFFVGYEQIMRDQNAENANGELTAKISMKPILTYMKLFFENQAANNFKIKKVVFKAPAGKVLPNVAYVKPRDIVSSVENYNAPWWAFTNGKVTDFMKADPKKDECGNVLAWGKYDRNTYDNAAARSMVQYASTVDGQIPYGMTDEEAVPAYEYVFNFPADADILMGHDGANNSTERICGISIALPAFEFADYDWQDMEVVVYGEMWDPTINYPEGGWRPGIVKKMYGVDNAEFNLDKYALWESGKGMDIPAVTARIDDNYFYQQTEIRVSTTKDLYDLINARLTNATTTENVQFEVQHYGNGLAITQEVVDLIKNYESKNKKDVVVKFNNVDRVNTPVILKAENCINEFEYVGVNVVVEAAQTVPAYAVVTGINELRNFSTLTVSKDASLSAVEIYNEVGATITNNGTILVYNNIHNDGTLNLNGKIDGNVENASKLIVANGEVTGKVVNDNQCINCGVGAAEITVNGTFNVGELVNTAGDIVTVNGTMNVNELDNAGTMTVNGAVVIKMSGVNTGTINNAGTITTTKTTTDAGTIVATLVNKNIINNNTTSVDGGLFGNITNEAVINAYKGKIADLNNTFDGKLYVYSVEVEVESDIDSRGTIIFVGVDPQHVGTEGKDNRIYQTTVAMKTSELDKVLTNTAARNLWVYNDITVDNMSNEIAGTIENIVIKAGKVNIKGIYQNMAITFAIATVSVDNGCELHIENALTMTVKEFSGNIHAGSNSVLKDNAGNELGDINHNQITVTTEAELTAAVTNVNNGGIVRLNEDIELTKVLSIAAKKEFTLDLNGKTLSGEFKGALIQNNGKLTIVNGTVHADGTTTEAVCLDNKKEAIVNCTMISDKGNAIQSDDDSKLTVNGGYYESKNNTGRALLMGGANDTAWELYINGGEFKGNYAAVSLRNNYAGLSTEGKAVIKNATLESNGVNGGAEITGVAVRNITIEGCSFKNKTIKNPASNPSNWDCIMNGYNLNDNDNHYTDVIK